ncbi:MAG: Bifunctional protein GlmU [Parcubacteria group bacterium GW2011_GWA2_42_11]|nr:MAG: Bifunctional protein GlmU [Parcubacteria group bacterium GW2011_GWA2_42_11]
MKELTDDLPKSLLPINGRPIIEYALENLPDIISEIILIVGYKSEMIKDHLGDNYLGKPIKYIEQKELNGTAGALWAARDLVKDKFLVMYGDDFYSKKDLEKLVANDLGLLAIETKTPQNFGVIELDEQGNLIRIVERPKEPRGNLTNTGAYVLDKRIFKYSMEPISETEFGLPQTIVKMVADWPVKVVQAEFWQGHNSQEDLMASVK